jgi:CRP-like cAMP-binding protein
MPRFGMALSLLQGVIANLPLFRQASRQHVAELARQARTQHVRRGATVCSRGETLHCFYAVAYGLVKLSLRSDTGEEKVLRLVGAGETFGEALVFKQRPNPLDAVALTDSMLVVLPEGAVNAMIDSDPHFARAMLAGLSERMHNMVAEVEASTLMSARQRLAAYLESLCHDAAATRVRLPASKTVIAARLGVTKETFSRLLREFVHARLIAVEKRDVVLLDRARLATEAHGSHAPVSGIPVSESSSA